MTYYDYGRERVRWHHHRHTHTVQLSMQILLISSHLWSWERAAAAGSIWPRQLATRARARPLETTMPSKVAEKTCRGVAWFGVACWGGDHNDWWRFQCPPPVSNQLYRSRLWRRPRAAAAARSLSNSLLWWENCFFWPRRRREKSSAIDRGGNHRNGVGPNRPTSMSHSGRQVLAQS